MTKQDETPEGQAYQTTCRECARQKCLKPERVAEVLRDVLMDGHRLLEVMASEAPSVSDWRWQTACFEGGLEIRLTILSRHLEGVCTDCQPKAFTAEDARLSNPNALHHMARMRWLFAVPLRQEQNARDALRAELLADVAAHGEAGAAIVEALTPPPTIRTITENGPLDAPCAWMRGGLAVTRAGGADLQRAKAARDAGDAEAYPTEAWVITHVASGTAIVGTYDMPDDAVRAARRLLPITDWVRSVEDLCADPAARAEMMKHVELETFRARWS